MRAIFLKKGKAVLTSTVGRKAVRDVYLMTNTACSEWSLIGTGETNRLVKPYSNPCRVKTLISRYLALHRTMLFERVAMVSSFGSHPT